MRIPYVKRRKKRIVKENIYTCAHYFVSAIYFLKQIYILSDGSLPNFSF